MSFVARSLIRNVSWSNDPELFENMPRRLRNGLKPRSNAESYILCISGAADGQGHPESAETDCRPPPASK